MAQRNPMNDRYTGDGPEGKTRKSAAKLKPKTEAASSVYIEKKPQTKQERKAARKKRERQEAAKEQERQRKREERERQARIDAGEIVEEPKKKGFLSQAKQIFVPQDGSKNQAPSSASSAPAKPSSQQTGGRTRTPNTPEYRKLKRIYWVLMGIGVAAIALSLLMNFRFPQVMDGWGMMVPMGVAYVAVIGAIILDYTKIRKLQRAHMSVDNSRKSPKQLKHEQEQAAAAQLLEESRKAQRELKRANSKNPFARKSKASADTDDEDAQGDDAQDDDVQDNDVQEDAASKAKGSAKDDAASKDEGKDETSSNAKDSNTDDAADKAKDNSKGDGTRKAKSKKKGNAGSTKTKK